MREGAEGLGVGRGRKWEEDWEVKTCILSFHHASERGGGRSSSSNPGWPSTSARHLESDLSFRVFLSTHNNPKGQRKRKRNPLTQ